MIWDDDTNEWETPPCEPPPHNLVRICGISLFSERLQCFCTLQHMGRKHCYCWDSQGKFRNPHQWVSKRLVLIWAAANGGVTNGGLRGVWPPFLEIGRNRPFSPFFCFFALFRRVRRAIGKSRKRRKKAFSLRYPRISLNPHLLNPHLRHSN